MSKISPCLWFAGQAEEAANLYISLIPNSRIVHVAKNTVDSLAGKAGSVLIVNFELAGETYQALNGGKPFGFTQSISLSVDCDDQAEVDRVWEGLLADGGEPVQCGWLTDKFGVSWQVIPRIMGKLMSDPDQVKAGRVMQAMMGMVKLDVAGLQAAYDGK